MKLLQDINNEGKTIIVVTHEPDVAAQTKEMLFCVTELLKVMSLLKQLCLIGG
jgi:putative ABC transport system ATP-binding protein